MDLIFLLQSHQAHPLQTFAYTNDVALLILGGGVSKLGLQVPELGMDLSPSGRSNTSHTLELLTCIKRTIKTT